MKKLFAIAFLALSTYMFSNAAYAQTACIAGTEKDFEAYVSKNNFDEFVFSPTAVKKFEAWLNKEKAKAGLPPIVIDKIEIAVVDRQKRLIGIVMFREGCVIPGTVLLFEAAVLFKTLEDAGVMDNEIRKVFSI